MATPEQIPPQRGRRSRAALVNGVDTRYNSRRITLTIEEIQRDLAAYLRRVEAGEILILIRDEVPMAEIKDEDDAHDKRRNSNLAAAR